MLKAFLAGVLLLAAQTAAAQPASTEHTAQVDAIFKEYAKDTSPGCAVGAYQGDRILLSKAYGMANLDHNVPLKPASVFHVASVSKQFTAAAILLLAQDGKLSIDDDIRKHLPELPDFGSKITIRHLVHHTSGIRDQWDLLTFAGWRYSRDLITDQDVLSLLSRQKDLNFTPGERHLYSNSGYTLMALIVNRASGKSFREFTRERIFAPLGMNNTHFRDNFNEIVRDQAYGYAPAASTFRLSVTNFDTAGATSLLTTVEDLAKWNGNFESKRVGGETLLAAMVERGVLNNGEKLGYAFGLTHGTYRGVPTIGHGGSDAGYRSAFFHFPEQRFGVSVLCNLAATNPGALAQRVADVFLRDALKPATTTPNPSEQPEVAMPPEQLARLAGLYWNATEPVALRFLVQEGKLQIVFGGTPQPLKSIGGDRFVRAAAAGPVYTFAADGSRVSIGPLDGPQTAQRVEPWTPTATDVQAFAGAYRSEEMDAIYRLTVKDNALQVNRLKSAPVSLEPLVKDVFRAPFGYVRVTRGAGGAVTGFVIDAGRVRGLKFAKESSATGTR